MAAARPQPFALRVSAPGSPTARYPFDQDRVVVGRGTEADLCILSSGVSRLQFLVEREPDEAGRSRFGLRAYKSTNPTCVERRPVDAAARTPLSPGEVISVGEVKVVLETRAPVSTGTMLGGAIVVALLALGLVYYTSGSDDGGGELTAKETRLFLDPPRARCEDPVECITRAKDAYEAGKRLLDQTQADPGNLYRAEQEFERAAAFQKQSGRSDPAIVDVLAQLDGARGRAEREFHDARFRLQRARARGNLRACAAEAATLARLVPDEHHPYRVKLDAYRRTLPRAKTGAPEAR